MNLALFDLDNTLLNGDSDYEWARFLIAKGVLDGEVHAARNDEFYRQYLAGTLDIAVFLDFQLAPLASHPRRQLDQWREEFLHSHILPIIGKPARQLVQQHLEAGDLTAVVTATNSFITGPIAQAFGIAHLIATIPAQENGQFTGKPRGLPSFRDGKIQRVADWLESIGLWWGSFERSYFYSDSLNDLPLLARVTHPVAVDPDSTLQAHAQSQNWPIISLRA